MSNRCVFRVFEIQKMGEILVPHIGNLHNPILSRWGLNLFWYNLLPSSLSFRSKAILLKYKQIELLFIVFSQFGFRQTHLRKKRYLNKIVNYRFQQLNKTIFLQTMSFRDYFNQLTYFYRVRASRSQFVKSKLWVLTFKNVILLISHALYLPETSICDSHWNDRRMRSKNGHPRSFQIPNAIQVKIADVFFF